MGEFADMALEACLDDWIYTDEDGYERYCFPMMAYYARKPWKQIVREAAKHPLFKDIKKLKKEGKL